MQQRRPPLGAMLVGLTALLAGWSMAALAGSGADREAGSDAPAADVPMVVTPPGGSNPQDAHPVPAAVDHDRAFAAEADDHRAGTLGEAAGPVGAGTRLVPASAGADGTADGRPGGATCSADGRPRGVTDAGGSERWAACSLGYGLRDPKAMREYTVTAAHCFDEAVGATAWNGSRRAAIGDWSDVPWRSTSLTWRPTKRPRGRGRRRTCGPAVRGTAPRRCAPSPTSRRRSRACGSAAPAPPPARTAASR